MDDGPYAIMVFDVLDLFDLRDLVEDGKPVSAEARAGIRAMNEIIQQRESGPKPHCLICKSATFDGDTPPAAVGVVVLEGMAKKHKTADAAGICVDCCRGSGWDAKAIGIGAADAYRAMWQHPLSDISCSGCA